jgi:hypothetical protein
MDKLIDEEYAKRIREWLKMMETVRIFEQEKRKRSKKRKSRKCLTKHCKTNAATFAKLEEIEEKENPS